jgi:hypothetical protein
MCCLSGCNSCNSPTDNNSGPNGSDGTSCVNGDGPGCPTCKLVSITVIQNATRPNASLDKTWATVRKATDDVIVQATTDPNTPDCWNQISWSGDAGTVVPGHPNQRNLSRAASKKYQIQASLGGVSDSLDVWVLWATVTILTSGHRPANAQPHPLQSGDNSDLLGAIEYDSIIWYDQSTQRREVRGKIVAVATIQPSGIHNVVNAGWALKRERWTHDWVDGRQDHPGNGHTNYWNTDWVDDTLAAMSMLTPDLDDKVYDTDAPDLSTAAVRDYETYNNFRQWLEWNGDRASDNSPWHFQARWQANRVTMKDVGAVNIPLPNTSFFHP